MSFEDAVWDEVNIIEDNDFLTKNIKDLVVGDYYLFHLTEDFMFLYKDDVVVKSSLLDNTYTKYSCNTETLQEFIESSVTDSLGESYEIINH